MIQFGTIVLSINNRIAESIAKMFDVRINCDKITYLYETNEMELKAFIGLWYMRGILNMNSTYVNFLFSSKYSHPIFFHNHVTKPFFISVKYVI